MNYILTFCFIILLIFSSCKKHDQTCIEDVYDTDCNNLSFLGGIQGNSEINGKDFSKATFVKTIWKN